LVINYGIILMEKKEENGQVDTRIAAWAQTQTGEGGRGPWGKSQKWFWIKMKANNRSCERSGIEHAQCKVQGRRRARGMTDESFVNHVQKQGGEKYKKGSAQDRRGTIYSEIQGEGKTS